MPPSCSTSSQPARGRRRYRTRPAEVDLAGLRDRALLLVGFFAALRRSELAALAVEHITEHPRGLVLELPRSKTNQTGTVRELVVLPRAGRSERCPVTALHTWLDAAAITDGPVLRKVSKANRPAGRGLHPESVNVLVQNAIARRAARLGLKPGDAGVSGPNDDRRVWLVSSCSAAVLSRTSCGCHRRRAQRVFRPLRLLPG
jgi:integrase